MSKKQRKIMLFFIATFILLMPITAQANWVFKNGNYYYYNSKGKILKKQWIEGYYVDKEGIRVCNAWVKHRFIGDDGRVISDFKGGWTQIGKKWFYYTKDGVKKTGWIKNGKKKYYLNKNGVMIKKWKNINGSRFYFHKKSGHMLTGWQKIKQNWYYFDPVTGVMQTGFKKIDKQKYCFDEKGVMLTGIQRLQGKTYYFTSTGRMLTGWQTIKKKKYFFSKKSGVMAKGLNVINGTTYYFGNNGTMQKNKTVKIDNTVYTIDSYGKCMAYKQLPEAEASEEMLFFLDFESGSASYAQTGGNNGCSCGAYQFDYRYSLLSFVKYCYSSDPVLFNEFKKYAKYSLTDKNKAKLKGNTQFYNVWKTIYKRSPKEFARYQDNYAIKEYYEVTAEYMTINYGIEMSGRSDVVKGAVFSYSLQHGAITAAMAVKAAGITNATADKEFIKLLYDYRWNSSSAWAKSDLHKSRYTAEKALALSLI